AAESRFSTAAGTMEDWFDGYRKDGAETMLIEIPNFSRGKGGSVDVHVYSSENPTPYAASGKQGMPGHSLTASPVTAKSDNIIQARFADGRLSSVEPSDLYIPYYSPAFDHKPLYLRSARMDLRLREDGGLEGILAGYVNIDELYRKEFTSVENSVPGSTPVKVAVFDG